MNIGFLRFVLALLSAGWLVPLWLGAWALLQFVEVELWPLLLQQPKLNSFPYLDFAGRYIAIGFLWLGAVVFGWAWAGLGALKRTQQRGAP